MFYKTFKLYKLLIFFMTFSMKRFFFVYYKYIAEAPPNLPLEKLVQTERDTKRKRIFFRFVLLRCRLTCR